MTFIFRNMTIFWDISKWNRGQKCGMGEVKEREHFVIFYSNNLNTKLTLDGTFRNI